MRPRRQFAALLSAGKRAAVGERRPTSGGRRKARQISMIFSSRTRLFNAHQHRRCRGDEHAAAAASTQIGATKRRCEQKCGERRGIRFVGRVDGGNVQRSRSRQDLMARGAFAAAVARLVFFSWVSGAAGRPPSTRTLQQVGRRASDRPPQRRRHANGPSDRRMRDTRKRSRSRRLARRARARVPLASRSLATRRRCARLQHDRRSQDDQLAAQDEQRRRLRRPNSRW